MERVVSDEVKVIEGGRRLHRIPYQTKEKSGAVLLPTGGQTGDSSDLTVPNKINESQGRRQ